MGTDPSRVAMSGPLTPFAAGFAGELARRGHAPGVVAVHLRLMAHLSRWLEARALGPADLGPSAVGSFVAVRRAAGCSSGRTAGSLAPLLGYLRAVGAAPTPQAAAAQGPVDVLIARYGAYLARERGLARATIERNAELVRPFLDGLVQAGQLSLGGLTAAEVSAFMVQRCRGRPSRAGGTGGFGDHRGGAAGGGGVPAAQPGAGQDRGGQRSADRGGEHVQAADQQALAGDLRRPERRALLGIPIDPLLLRVDVHEREHVRAGQQRSTARRLPAPPGAPSAAAARCPR